jgi:ribonucleoside-triphosphate reductase (formate)
LYNLEATPGEGASTRLSEIDRKEFPDIIVSGKDTSYYTNSTQLPVDFSGDLFDALSLQDEIQQQYTGGTVFHCFLGESIDNPATARELVMRVADKFGLPYFTLTPTFSICPEHGYIRGQVEKCPSCGSDTEIYSRIVGYFRPVTEWNKGKAAEFKDRTLFTPDLEEKEATGNDNIGDKRNVADRLSGQDSDGDLHEQMQLPMSILSQR